MRAILAIDQGTTNSKAVLVSETGRRRRQRLVPGRHLLPAARLGRNRSRDRIWRSVCEAIEACLKTAPMSAIEAVAISNQRESVTVWDAETGESLGPVVSWQCRRTRARLRAPDRRGDIWIRVQALTGLPIDPMFPGPKFRWLLDRARPGRPVRLGTIDSWLIHCLTGGRSACLRCLKRRPQPVVRPSGSRSGATSWRHLRRRHRLPCPQVRDSSADFGIHAALPGVPDGTPIRAAIGDSHAALSGMARSSRAMAR